MYILGILGLQNRMLFVIKIFLGQDFNLKLQLSIFGKVYFFSSWWLNFDFMEGLVFSFFLKLNFSLKLKNKQKNINMIFKSEAKIIFPNKDQRTCQQKLTSKIVRKIWHVDLEHWTYIETPPKIVWNWLIIDCFEFSYVGENYFFMKKLSTIKINLFMKDFPGVLI